MPEVSSSDPILEPLAYTPGGTTTWNNSWRQLYDQFANAILAYARRRGLNDHSAHDALQEVMVTLIRCQHQPEHAYDPAGGSFQSWLWGVIRNRVRSVRRKDNKEEALSPIPRTEPNDESAPTLPEVAQAPHDFGQTEESQWQQALFAAALHKVQARVTHDNFAIYAALLEERATVEELAQTHGKQPNAIYAVKHRCEKIFLAEARAIRTTWEQLRTTSTREQAYVRQTQQK
jgi:RNA polymerase sigma factor (sigma-70 family)